MSTVETGKRYTRYSERIVLKTVGAGNKRRYGYLRRIRMMRELSDKGRHWDPYEYPEFLDDPSQKGVIQATEIPTEMPVVKFSVSELLNGNIPEHLYLKYICAPGGIRTPDLTLRTRSL